MSEAGPNPSRWQLPTVEGPIISRRTDQTVNSDPYERANQSRGYQAGMAAARAETQAQIEQLKSRVSRLDAILKLLSRPLEELDSVVEKQLTLLAVTVGKQILRRELRTDPAQIVAVIRESVARLPVAARDIRVQLHPEDAAVVRENLAATTADRAWTIVEDPALARGGCLVRTDSSQIDARIDSRVNAIVAAALGDERTPDRGAGEDQI
jgi:flagellar assembly protein FliH